MQMSRSSFLVLEKTLGRYPADGEAICPQEPFFDPSFGWDGPSPIFDKERIIQFRSSGPHFLLNIQQRPQNVIATSL